MCIRDSNDSVHIRQLVEDLQANGALARNDQLIVIGVDKGCLLYTSLRQRPS